MTFAELIQKLTAHLSPKPSEITERFRFHKRDQTAGESVTVYMAELRRLAIHCNFEDSLSKTLRDRFVCGLKQEHIQKRLLAESQLDLEKAIQTAVAMETASRDALELQGKRESVSNLSVNKTKKTNYGKMKPRPVHKTVQGKCYRCGGEHRANDCKHTNTKCRYCSKVGHWRECVLRRSVKTGGKLNYVDTDEYGIDNYEDNGGYLLHFSSYYRDVNKVSIDSIIVTPKIAGSDIPMEVDTRSAVSIISKTTLYKFLKSYTLEDTDTRLKTYSGEQIRPVDKKVFEPGIGKLSDIKGKLTMQDGVRPKFDKAREVAYSLRFRVEEELNRLQQEGVISPIEFSDWATPI
ncbi:uncharacterized protein LOC134247923 [Saccostrea cucullata]|uniref:uncharacterized protein LOC134247923 n=1 Tax=Saccostrea cuccullata TaxID=36930 RepID=UPI002ED4C4C6